MKSRQKLAAQKRKLQRHSLHIKRVFAELAQVGKFGLPANISSARVILNDLTPKGLYVFSAKPFLLGQEVSVRLNQPKNFYAKGRVISCVSLSSRWRILSQEPYHYRIGILFEFVSKEELTAVSKYCRELLSSLCGA